jgi:signal transduction histidine kinase
MAPEQFFVFLQLLVTIFLVVLLWCVYARLRKQEFFRWWAWAWTASAAFLVLSVLPFGLGPAWTPLKNAAISLTMLFGFLEAAFLLFGAWSLRFPGMPSRRWLRLGSVLALAACGLSLLLARLWSGRPDLSYTLRSAPRMIALAAALFCCAVLFFARWGKGRASAAAISGGFCLLYGINQGLYALDLIHRLIVGPQASPHPYFASSVRGYSILGALDVMYVSGICLGMVLLLVEEHRRAERALLESVSYSREMTKNNVALQAEIREREKAEASLRNLTFRVMQIQEEERARIARELHDDISQRLGVLTFQLDQVWQDSFQAESPASRQLIALAKIAHQLCGDIQHLTLHLHPSHVEIVGLVSAVSGFCVEYARQNRFEVEFLHSAVPDTLPHEVKLCLYRVAQEAIRNSHKHSGSCHVRIELSGAGGAIRLLVSDTGKGFESASARAEGLGLVSMAERVKSLGGQFRVQSRPGDGTSVEAIIPLAQSASAS